MVEAKPKWRIRPAIDTTIEWLLFLPVAVTIGQLIVHRDALFAWLFSLVLVRLVGVLVMAKTQQRLVLILIGIVLSMVSPLLLSISYSQVAVLTTVGAVSFWRSVRIVAATDYLYPSALYVVGLLTYAGYSVLASQVSLYQPLLPLLTVLAFLCVLLVLLEVNRVTLGEASFTDTENLDASNQVKQTNRIYVVALVTVVVILSAFWRVLATISRMWQGAIGQPRGTTQPPATHPHSTQMPKMQQVVPGPFSHVLSILFQVIGIALLCVVGGWFALQAGKLIALGVSSLIKTLRGRVERQDHRGYVDLVESLKTPRRKDRLALRRRSSAKRAERWDDLVDNREKVRFIYRRVVGRAVQAGFPWSASATSMETAEKLHLVMEQQVPRDQVQLLARLYNEARYSAHPLDDREVNESRTNLVDTRWTVSLPANPDGDASHSSS